jgi:hypothetical protein
MIDRLMSLVVAVSLALLVWLYARSREQEVLDNVTVPVEVTVAPRQADNYNLEVNGPAQVVASFSGPPARIRELHGMLQRKELHVTKVLAVPAERQSESRYSDDLVVEPADLNPPVGVTALLNEGKSRIRFTLHRLVEKRLPVRFDCVREGPTGPVILDPPTVLVRGPREVLDRTTCISTQPTDMPSRPLHAPPNYTAIGRAALPKTLEGRPIQVTPGWVMVRVPWQSRKLYELTDVPVQFLCPAGFPLKPKFIDERSGKVTLKLAGPVKEEPPKVYAFIDLTRGKFASGLNHEPLLLQLPEGFQLAQEAPRVVAFELLPGDFVPDGLGMPAPPPTSR